MPPIRRLALPPLLALTLLVSTTLDASAVAARADSDGPVQPIDLSRYQGDLVVLAFIATWCGSCHSALPTLNRWAARYAERGVHVVGVSKEDAERLARYRDEEGLHFELARDPDGALMTRYEVRALPTFVVLDRDGDRRGRFRGAGGTLPRVEALVKSLLGDSDGPTFGALDTTRR